MSALFGNYKTRPIQIVKGKGTTVWDENGKSYLDFTSGIAVLSLGHANPILVDTIKHQSELLWHTSNLFENKYQEKLAEKLVKDTHLSHAFFCNSGTEANEAAIKLARKHTGKHKIITCLHSFHGRTFGSMSATGQEKVHKGFGPIVEKFEYIPFNDVDSLLEKVDDETAAIMLEVVQGEGGVHVITPEFAQAIQKICDEKGILCIVDEVQTGIGRTGTAYAYEQTALKPDIVTLAKGLAGGFPIGAMLGTAELYESFGPGTHGTTFGGNPLAMAVATAVIEEIFTKAFLKTVTDKSQYFKEKLQAALPASVEIRGMGLLLGITCDSSSKLVEITDKNGLLLVPAGEDVVRLLPPLTVSYDEIDQAVEILQAAIPVTTTVK
ncbi:acetylornithine transaminase [Rummeliibacillus sp. TYF005]|uniref:acetylornithine transaminase n=1 Tax=Rummeliibacillus sp. TYF005 TaxID=2058214 RepID=UPI000F51C68D|nr:acetylornithine transaminase [Rummeliibacillus sp. TYF005]RPJ95651.1 acetylornithine transaminase [Rummeliibacillus sp. TYF005]